MKIAIDIDQTIFECDSFLYKIINFIMPGQSEFKKLKYKSIDEDDVSTERLINKISRIHNPKFYSINENANVVVNRLYNDNHEIILLSSRPASRALCNVLMACIKKYDIKFNQIIVECNNKSAFCKENGIDVIIDNSADTCDKCSKNGIFSICYIQDEEKAERYRSASFKVAKSWDEIETIFRKISLTKMR